jgi:hypothetical protein
MAIAVLATLITAVAVNQMLYPQTATVPANSTLIAYLDGNVWPNETTIEWGTVNPGATYTKNFTVYNNGNVNMTVALELSSDQPVGWIETWTANNTLLTPKTSAIGTLSLQVPLDAVGTSYAWTSWVTVT